MPKVQPQSVTMVPYRTKATSKNSLAKPSRDLLKKCKQPVNIVSKAGILLGTCDLSGANKKCGVDPRRGAPEAQPADHAMK